LFSGAERDDRHHRHADVSRRRRAARHGHHLQNKEALARVAARQGRFVPVSVNTTTTMRSPCVCRVPRGRRQAPAPKSHNIPDPSAPNAVSVTDGTYCAGIVVEHDDGKHYAFDPDGYLIGKFQSRALAVAALRSPMISATARGVVS
jgi:Tfp pilus assembly protein FimT